MNIIRDFPSIDAKIYLKYNARDMCIHVFLSPFVFSVGTSSNFQEFSKIQSLIGTEILVLPLQFRRPVRAGYVLCMGLALSRMIPCELPQSWQKNNNLCCEWNRAQHYPCLLSQIRLYFTPVLVAIYCCFEGKDDVGLYMKLKMVI